MNYLTNYYKNLSEQLQEKLNILEKLLNETSSKSDTDIAKKLMDTDVEELFNIQGKGSENFRIKDVNADTRQAVGNQYSPESEVIHAAVMAKMAEARKKKVDSNKTPEQIEMERAAMNPQENATPAPWSGRYQKLSTENK